MALCPAHDDHNPSLSIRQLEDGKIMFKCFAGCKTEDVVASVGLRMKDLFPDEKTAKSRFRTRPAAKSSKSASSKNARNRGSSHGLDGMVETAEYVYTDEDGKSLFKVLRFEDPKGVRDKEFRQKSLVRRNGLAGWEWKLDGVRRVLYHLPRTLKIVDTDIPIIVVEGEKDVHSLETLGLVATCNSGGASK